MEKKIREDKRTRYLNLVAGRRIGQCESACLACLLQNYGARLGRQLGHIDRAEDMRLHRRKYRR